MAASYIEWYKARMNRILDPEYFSLMSSSVEEPWEQVEIHVKSLGTRSFNERFRNSNAYGLPALIEKICRRYSLQENKLLVTQGVTSAIFLLSAGFLKKGDHVLVETPGYQPLRQAAEICGAVVEAVSRPSGHPIDPQSIRNRLNARTRLIIMTDLHNPTGWQMSDQEILSIVEVMKERSPDAYLIVDEIYRDFVPGFRAPAATLDERIISTSSLTKVYGLSLLRCGWIIANASVIETLRKVQILVSGIGSRYLETVSSVVFDHLEEYRAKSLQTVTRNRTIVEDMLEPLMQKGCIEGSVPEWGCVYFPRINGVSDTHHLADFLEMQSRLMIVPGAFFDAPDHIRIGFGEISSDRLVSAMTRLIEGIQSFQIQSAVPVNT